MHLNVVATKTSQPHWIAHFKFMITNIKSAPHAAGISDCISQFCLFLLINTCLFSNLPSGHLANFPFFTSHNSEKTEAIRTESVGLPPSYLSSYINQSPDSLCFLLLQSHGTIAYFSLFKIMPLFALWNVIFF